MRIGIDFDNTIVSYDYVFHKVAVEKKLIDKNVKVSKISVRNKLREQGMEEQWIEMQGYVYGKRMDEATVFNGFFDFIQKAKGNGADLFVISHKTRYPYVGEKYDLHQAARSWLAKHFKNESGPLISPQNISFHETKKEKIDQISDLNCDVFVDDLPEIFMADNFPDDTRKILFDPDKHHGDNNFERAYNWEDVSKFLLK